MHLYRLLRHMAGFTLALTAVILLGNCACNSNMPKEVNMSRAQLMDKIKGGWAGQTIGVSYGAPTEFHYLKRIIPDSVAIPWGDPDYITNMMTKSAGVYDDVYMDLTFVEVFDRLGVDAPADSLAHAFAYAGYPLWHANQAARYNILNGVKPPYSGHWRNNPHADDIDFQIEADFAGLMSPGMPVTAAEICDRAGHIMNYGDGWYGGVYIAAMYSLAFISDDVEYVVREALKMIPPQSRYYRCIADMIDAYEANPDDWTAAWQRCEEKWDSVAICADGALADFNIDATVNSAYVVIGLLYGKGDFGATIDIATRCGQDSDCNPASAGGILGTIIGYSNIPEEWLAPLYTAEGLKFAYTSSSLADTYVMSFDQALEVITRNGGEISDASVTIKCQKPEPVAYEQSFDGMQPVRRTHLGKYLADGPCTVEVDADGMLCSGWAHCDDKSYVAQVQVNRNGVPVDTLLMPAEFRSRRHDVYWNFDIKAGEPTQFTFTLLNPAPSANVTVSYLIEIQR